MCPTNTPETTRAARLTSWIGYCATVVTLLISCSGERPAPKPNPPDKSFTPITDKTPQGQNLVLIVVDTLRADHLGCYGYKKRPTSPHIDQLSKEGITFSRFYSAAPWTAPAFASMLTGVSPPVHQAGRWRKTGVPDLVKIGTVNIHPINKTVKTMAQLLTTHESAVFSSNPFLTPKLGFARGVDYYDQTPRHRRANVITDLAIKWLTENRGHPLFAMIHYMDPHTPYDPEEPARNRFVKKLNGRIKVPFAPNNKEAKELHPTNAELETIIALYDAEIRNTDESIGRLLAHLDKIGFLKNSWVILTADHGEEHWDHGHFNHGFQYEDEVTRVPLIIRAPGGKWGRGVRVPFSAPMIDLLPTVLDWFDTPLPPYLEGQSLMTMLSGQATGDRLCYMESSLFREPFCALYDGRFKLARSQYSNKKFLYDHWSDPGEQNKLRPGQPPFERIEQKLDRYLRQHVGVAQKRVYSLQAPLDNPPVKHQQLTKSKKDGALSIETVNALKELGYID